MVVKMKAIKAKPKHPGFIMPAMSKGMAEGGKILLKAAEGVVKTWNDPPDFELKVFLGPRPEAGIIATVTTEDMRWVWTDRGTKPHIIRPRNAKRLAFPSVFTPKSTPNSLKASSGSSGGPTVYAQEVHHPGTEPRHFTEEIHRQFHADFARAVSDSIAKWARKG